MIHARRCNYIRTHVIYPRTGHIVRSVDTQRLSVKREISFGSGPVYRYLVEPRDSLDASEADTIARIGARLKMYLADPDVLIYELIFEIQGTITPTEER